MYLAYNLFIMQKWKFLLLGITGDLSKRFVLPSLAKFAELYKDSVCIDLIGYSRSKPDMAEIETILNGYTESSRHVLHSISDFQGEYEDESFLNRIIESLEPEERLVVYFATPPVLIAKLLNNFCIHSSKNIDILIEKPVGQNNKEAKVIFDLIEKCNLFNATHFIDHYLFKSSLYLTEEEKERLEPFKDKGVKSIKIQALEELDAKGRAGYYDQNGAIKDFLPSHLVSLMDFGLMTFTNKEHTTKIYDSFKVNNLTLGQYESYLKDIEAENSNTETYFKIEGTLEDDEKTIDVLFESGKKLHTKQTCIHIDFIDGEQITWNVGSHKYIEISNTEDILLQGNGQREHVNMFSDVLHRRYNRFFIRNMIIQGWNIYDAVMQFKETHNIQLQKYTDDTYPPRFIS